MTPLPLQQAINASIGSPIDALCHLAASAGGSGAAGQAGDLFARIWPMLLGLLVLAVVGGLFAMWLRRRIGSQDAGATQGFTLDDLRQMHKRGEMSDEEFAQAKSAMLSKRPSREEMADKLVKPKTRTAAPSPKPRPDRSPDRS